MDRHQTNVQKNNFALAHPYHEGKWGSKFGWIPSGGLGGDSMMDRWMDKGCTDARKNNVALAHPYHEGKWYSKFDWIPPSGLGGDSVIDSGLGGDSVTDKWMDDGCIDGHTEKNAALAHPYHEGKWCSRFGRIPPNGLGGDRMTDGGVNNIPIAF